MEKRFGFVTVALFQLWMHTLALRSMPRFYGARKSYFMTTLSNPPRFGGVGEPRPATHTNENYETHYDNQTVPRSTPLRCIWLVGVSLDRRACCSREAVALA